MISNIFKLGSWPFPSVIDRLVPDHRLVGNSLGSDGMFAENISRILWRRVSFALIKRLAERVTHGLQRMMAEPHVGFQVVTPRPIVPRFQKQLAFFGWPILYNANGAADCFLK